jgi:hypothetical protein
MYCNEVCCSLRKMYIDGCRCCLGFNGSDVSFVRNLLGDILRILV